MKILTAAAIIATCVVAHVSGADTVTTRAAPPTASDTSFAIAPPPFSEGVFPCSRCHKDITPDRTSRPLRWAHDTIVLKHDEENRWCLDCHDADNRDKLHLASGKLIDFAESYKLCGQCHGPKLRDWKAGIHGKRTGEWTGVKRHLLCAHCHDPHSPRFKPMVPMPKPKSPSEIRPEQGGED